MKLGEIAKHIGGKLVGPVDASLEISGVQSLDAAGGTEISFLSNPLYTKHLEDCRAAAVIVSPDCKTTRAAIVCKDSYRAFRDAMVLLHGWRKCPFEGISDKADIAPSADIGSDVAIGAFVCVSADAVIGDRVVLYPGVYIGPGAKIGSDTVLYPNVVVYEGCEIGQRTTLHANTVIGQDGFGYATDSSGVHHKIPQAGKAVIGSDVELGAGCTIDRSAIGTTEVGDGSKFSNQVAIGHGSRIGPGNLFVAQSGIAGSTTTGKNCAFGGQSGVVGHVNIGDYVRVGAQSGVSSSIGRGQSVLGSPAAPIADARRMLIASKSLPEMKKQLKELAKRIEKIEEMAKLDGVR